MDYIELQVKVQAKTDFYEDLIIAELGVIGYDSFEQEAGLIKAYVEKSKFSEVQLANLQNTHNNDFGIVEFSWYDIKTENWNAKWEEQFQCVEINDNCIIRAPFHILEKKYEFDILIEPKMSFGTGHHATTALMIETILELDITNKSVVDCGCGTGVLGIASVFKGATNVVGFDIDDWCYINTIENIQLNKLDLKKFDIKCGGFEVISPIEKFDVVIANINRNILINSMQQLSDCMKQDGVLLLSGFYEEDIAKITDAALENNLKLVSYKEKKRWVACKFTK